MNAWSNALVVSPLACLTVLAACTLLAWCRDVRRLSQLNVAMGLRLTRVLAQAEQMRAERDAAYREAAALRSRVEVLLENRAQGGSASQADTHASPSGSGRQTVLLSPGGGSHGPMPQKALVGRILRLERRGAL